MLCKKLLFIVFLFSTTRVSAQDGVDAGPIPSASGANNSVSNNLFDGSANINLPFYSSGIDGVAVNVNGQYSTKGIKVDQVASSMGLGWELYTGPTIYRVVNDIPDEMCTGLYKTYTGSYYDTHGPMLGMWYNPTYNTSYNFNNYWQVYDDEFDRFTLNLNGRSIQFQIGRSGTILIIPKCDIKIEKVINGTVYPSTIPTGDIINSNLNTAPSQQTELRFNVTDESGNKYYFVRGDVHLQRLVGFENDSRRIDYGWFPAADYEVADKWVISKIVTYSGNEINYSYTKSNVDYKLSRYETLDEPTIGSPSYVNKYHSSRGFISYIDKISMPNSETVNFSYSSRIDVTATKRLSAINIDNKFGYYDSGSEIQKISRRKSYLFDFAYFQYQDGEYSAPDLDINATYAGAQENLRLKLNGIRVNSNNSTEKLYEFSYNTHSLPPRMSLSQDLYGYYNGAVPVTLNMGGYSITCGVALHTYYNTTFDVGVSKISNSTHAQACILNVMKYGSGGSTEFYYDDHTIDNTTPAGVNLSSTKDGLRLYKKIEKSGYNKEKDIATIYRYPQAESFLPGGNISYPFQDYNNGIHSVFSNTFTSANLNINGSNHGYSQVETDRYTWDPNSNDFTKLLDKSISEFSNVTENLTNYTNVTTNHITPVNYANDPANTFFLPYYSAPFTNKTYLRESAIGLPVRTRYYDLNDNLISTVTNKYQIDDDATLISQFRSQRIMYSKLGTVNNPSTYYVDTYYPFASFVKLVEAENEKNFGGSFLNQKTAYAYDAHNNVKILTTDKGIGEHLVEKKYYSYDWTNVSTAGNAITKLNTDNVTKLLFSEKWKSSVGGSFALLGVSLTGFNIFDNYVRPSYSYNILSVNGTDEGTYGSNAVAALDMSTAGVGGPINGFKRVTGYSYYDNLGNPMLTTNFPNSNTSSLYHLGKQIATVTNALPDEIAFTSFDGYYERINSKAVDGNWSFDPVHSFVASTVNKQNLSGNIIFSLTPNVPSNILSTSGLQLSASKKYILSFWYTGGQPIIRDNGQLLNVQVIDNIRGGWVNGYVEFNASGGQITIGPGSSNCYVDEVRLYPDGSKMSTVTFDPQFGPSAVCNENNQFTTYEYDDLGRQIGVFDHLGRVISKNKFVQQGND